MILNNHQKVIFVSIVVLHLIFSITTIFCSGSDNQTENKSILENWKDYLENCSDAYNVDILRGLDIMSEEKQLVLTLENEKCFVKCIGESLTFINPNGSINETSLQPIPWFINGNKVLAAIRKCSRIIGTSPCDKAYQQTTCFFDIASIDVSSE